MRLAAIAIMTFFENELKQKILPIKKEDTWKDALRLAFGEEYGVLQMLKELPDDLEEAKASFFDADTVISVVFYDTNQTVE